MTNEEAREQLKDIARSFSREYFHDWREALDFAIKVLEQQSYDEDFIHHKKEVLERIDRREREIDKYIKELEELEQQPCEDCISRQAVIDKATSWDTHFADSERYVSLSDIMTLPSVTPTSEDISEAYLKGYDYGVKDWFKSKTQPCEDAVSKQIRDCENCIHHKDGCCEVWECKFEAKEEESEDSDEETETR